MGGCKVKESDDGLACTGLRINAGVESEDNKQ